MIEASTAEGLITGIRARGGRIFRAQSDRTFVLTQDRDLVADLIALGASYTGGFPGGYARGDKREWDIEISSIEKRELRDEETDEVRREAAFTGIWEAAAPLPAEVAHGHWRKNAPVST